ncbi:MAG: histidine kinase [Bacteroidota bacterium]
MRITYYFFLPLLMALSWSCEQVPSESFDYAWQRVQQGDSTVWANPQYNDQHWERYFEGEPISDSIYWVRLWVKLPDVATPRTDFGIRVGGTGSYQAYWDGQYIGANGILAEKGRAEVPGNYSWYSTLPDSLAQGGAHLLALRTTKGSPQPTQHAFFMIGNIVELTSGPLQVSKYMFLLGGIFLVTALYFLLLFLGQPKAYSNLLFSIVYLIFLGILFFEYLKLFYLYPYPFQRTRLEIISYLHLASAVLIPSFFVFHFDFPWKKSLYVLLATVLGFLQYNYPTNFDWLAQQLALVLWCFSMGIVVHSVYERKEDALAVVVGLLGCLATMYFTPQFYVPYVSDYDVSLFLSFGLLAITMVYVMTRRRKRERLSYEESLVRSERLKNELLKKNIRPHFIMNTLTSLMDWVEESPQEGAAFIGALAEEFELLNNMADAQLVPIGQEIDLCKNHLKVMGYRKEIQYEWTQEGVDPNELIPPAIIHTAVENGVTHSLPDKQGRVLFHLSFSKTKKKKHYQLRTQARMRSASPSLANTEKRGGTGLKYMRARLQESYPGRWALASKATPQGWLTTIVVRE